MNKYKKIDYLIERARHSQNDELLLLLMRKKTSLQAMEHESFEQCWLSLVGKTTKFVASEIDEIFDQ